MISPGRAGASLTWTSPTHPRLGGMAAGSGEAHDERSLPRPLADADASRRPILAIAPHGAPGRAVARDQDQPCPEAPEGGERLSAARGSCTAAGERQHEAAVSRGRPVVRRLPARGRGARDEPDSGRYGPARRAPTVPLPRAPRCAPAGRGVGRGLPAPLRARLWRWPRDLRLLGLVESDLDVTTRQLRAADESRHAATASAGSRTGRGPSSRSTGRRCCPGSARSAASIAGRPATSTASACEPWDSRATGCTMPGTIGRSAWRAPARRSSSSRGSSGIATWRWWRRSTADSSRTRRSVIGGERVATAHDREKWPAKGAKGCHARRLRPKMNEAPQLRGSARLQRIAGAGLEPATPAL